MNLDNMISLIKILWSRDNHFTMEKRELKSEKLKKKPKTKISTEQKDDFGSTWNIN